MTALRMNALKIAETILDAVPFLMHTTFAGFTVVTALTGDSLTGDSLVSAMYTGLIAATITGSTASLGGTALKVWAKRS